MILNFKIDKKDRIIFLWCSTLRIEKGTTNTVPPRLNIDIKTGGPDDNSWMNRRKNTEPRIKEIDNEKIKLRPPDSINIFKYSISGKPIQPKKESLCLNCGQKVENYRLYEISFKTIIEGHDNRKRDKQYYNIFDKINMTSSGIEVMPSFEKKSNNEVYDKLKSNKLNNFIIPKIIQELYPKLKFQDYFNLKNDTVFRSKTTCVCDDCYLEITKYCSMAGSNNENLIRTLKKDECLSPFYDLVKSMRPKSVIRKNKNIMLDELNKDEKQKDIYKNKKNKFNYYFNDEKTNLFSYIREKDKKKIKNNLTNNNSKTPNISFKPFSMLSTNNIKKKSAFSILPKIPNLNNLNESNLEKKNDFNEFTMKMYTEVFNNKGLNLKFDESKKNSTDSKKILNQEGLKRIKLKNYLTKNDFTYFN
jgi:hypothetical protein